MTNEIIDKDLGRIIFIRNNRAKRIIARKKSDHISVTIPSNYTIQKATLILEKLKPRLLKLKSKPVFKFTEDTVFKTFSFWLQLNKSNQLNNYYASIKNQVLTITCPQATDFEREDTQVIIKQIIEKALRNEAKGILPEKVKQIANIYGFTFSSVKINKSKTRWGSCSSRKSINLSYYCMLLPEHLIDFIIKHELCHTIEMNHSEKFWALLDKISDNKAKLLTKELKTHSTTVF